MHRRALIPFCLAVCLLAAAGSHAADRRPVVAVFDVQTKRVRLPKAQKDMLTYLLGQELGIGGVFQVMPPGDVKRTLLEQSSASYKACYDEKCQIALGRQLPANKLVTTTVMRVGGKCRVAASLYDLRRQTTDIVAKHKCPCKEAELAAAIEAVAGKLRAFQSGGGARPAFEEKTLGEDAGEAWEPETGQETIVRFESTPAGAVVLVDGNLVCQQTPCSKSVRLGFRQVSMQAPRYQKKQSRIKVAANTQVKWTLQPNFGWLKVTTAPVDGLDVKVNGQVVGQTPIERLEREPGVYEVLVVSPCHYDYGKRIRIERGKGQQLNIGMRPKQGAVKVSAKDEGGNDLVAQVYADGKLLGKTPGTYKVSICAKELEVRHPRYGSRRSAMQIHEKKVSPVVVSFGPQAKTAGDAPAAGGQAPIRTVGSPDARYFLVSIFKKKGAAQYDIDVYINNKLVRSIKAHDNPVVKDVTSSIKRGAPNDVLFVSRKNLGGGGRASTSKQDYRRVIIGAGSLSGGNLKLESIFVEARRTAAETKANITEKHRLIFR